MRRTTERISGQAVLIEFTTANEERAAGRDFVFPYSPQPHATILAPGTDKAEQTNSLTIEWTAQL